MSMTARQLLQHNKSDPSMNLVQQVALGHLQYNYDTWKRNRSLQHSAVLFNCVWSFLGTVVMKVIATDADQVNTSHSKIHYSIAQQTNIGGMFYINSETGEVRVQRNTLDREVRY